jgi:hypothetical protein
MYDYSNVTAMFAPSRVTHARQIMARCWALHFREKYNDWEGLRGG